ncbi:MAG: flavin reductase [Zoogloea sp.]|jgi:flavin reductase|nr:MAG: flavin reductase [Zoogloea sp.]
MVSIDLFRDGMARLAGAVNLITTDGRMGFAGITATAVCSVTDQPPTLLTCINRSSYAHGIFSANGVMCVNVLAADQQDVAQLFANRNISMPDRLARIATHLLATGSPALDGALVSFDCRIVQQHPLGSHDLFIGEVQAVTAGGGAAGLTYFQRNYHPVGSPSLAQATG